MNLPTSTPCVLANNLVGLLRGYLTAEQPDVPAGQPPPLRSSEPAYAKRLDRGAFRFYNAQGLPLVAQQPGRPSTLNLDVTDLVGAWGRVSKVLIDVGGNRWEIVQLVSVKLGVAVVQRLT